MTTHQLEYEPLDRAALDQFLENIEARFCLLERPSTCLRSVTFDTFDWRLFLDEGLLEWLQAPALLTWTPLGAPAREVSQPCPSEPAFAADLPDGPVRERILGISGIRRLLPLVEVETRTSAWALLDDEEKTVLRLALDESQAQGPGSAARWPLPIRLRVLPIRGYDDELAVVLAIADATLGARCTDKPVVLEALELIGRRPADYSSKMGIELNPGAPADAVTRSILFALLDTLTRNLPGARANLDPEFLHDLRVAVRRTRSALGQIRPVFAEEAVDRFKERFAWLQQVTGPVRDLDVYLLQFDDYQRSLPPSMGPHLQPLRAFLVSGYAEEQRRLRHILGSAELGNLLRDWRQFLTAPMPEPPDTGPGAQSIRPLADARLRRMAKRARREGLAITPDSPAEDLHELRKTCKKLRYLMEFFQSLYPERELRVVVRLMKRILDNLGDFQDLAVQAMHLRALAERLHHEGRADTDTLLAMGGLITHLLERQVEARAEFADTFAGFLADETRQRLRTLFGKTSRRGPSSIATPGPEG